MKCPDRYFSFSIRGCNGIAHNVSRGDVENWPLAIYIMPALEITFKTFPLILGPMEEK